MIRKISGLLMVVLIVTSITLGAEQVSTQATEDHLIHKIITNHTSCVHAFDKDKIFIRPENIISTTEGLFLRLNESEYFPLPLLQFNRNGHFLQGSLMKEMDLAATKKQTKGPCPNCDVDTDKYGVCVNKGGCFFYGLRVL